MEVEEEPLFSWHANLITVNHRKTVVLVNDKNRYSIVLYGLKARNFQRFDEHILEAIKETFREECIKDRVVEEFINYSKGITFTKTKNRSMVAKMNKACDDVHFYARLLDNSSIYQPQVSKKCNRYLVGDRNGSYMYPNKEMYQDLETFSGEAIFGCKAAIIKITLELEKQEVWRRLVVPVNISFPKLHEVIQYAFGWKNYHLHQFFIYDENIYHELFVNHPAYHKDNKKPIINLVSSEEDLAYQDEYGVDMKLVKGIKLSEYIPARIKYIYDYGDNWEHYIEIEKIIEDYDRNYPVCLEGEGNTHPEDVGGESGYEQFLEALADENHPEHDFMLKWGEGQGYKDFDIEEVNKVIKRRY